MTLGMILLIVGVGLVIGGASGLVGIGGGILIIPVLMIGFGFTQEHANGTSLAMMLPPVGILAVITYARAGNVDWRFAALLAIGFFVGASIGGTVVNRGWINPTALRILFGLLLLYVGARTLFRSGGQARAAMETIILVGTFAVLYTTFKLLGRSWETQASRWGTLYRTRRRDDAEFDFEI